MFKVGDRIIVKENYREIDKNNRILCALAKEYYDIGSYTGKIFLIKKYERIEIGIEFDKECECFHTLSGRLDGRFGYWLTSDMIELTNPNAVELI